MPIRCLTFLAAFLVFGASHVLALEVTEGSITTEINNRQPIDEVQSVSVEVGKLFCFTRVAGASGGTSIFHVWYRNGVEMARVELPVRSSDWRTWSSKRLVPHWRGEWRVEVLDPAGELLRSLSFNLY